MGDRRSGNLSEYGEFSLGDKNYFANFCAGSLMIGKRGIIFPLCRKKFTGAVQCIFGVGKEPENS